MEGKEKVFLIVALVTSCENTAGSRSYDVQKSS